MSSDRYAPEPDEDTPTQEEFIRRLAAFPHSRDSDTLKGFELAPLRYLNDIVEVAREIAKRDGLTPND